ncbi:MAG: hypothetical protein FJ009_22450 [Chloroflexi bacterium]|nr:hypothetical protein [Chloroflexota bacterium]
MGANKKKLSSISKADTLEKIGAFWDTHDFTEHDDPAAPDVQFKVTCAVPVDADLLAQLENQAQRRGVRVETLVNLWLQQMLARQALPTA